MKNVQLQTSRFYFGGGGEWAKPEQQSRKMRNSIKKETTEKKTKQTEF